MKLWKAEHLEKGTWYFSNRSKLARYIDCQPAYVYSLSNVGAPFNIKGWNIELIYADDVISKYIDPEV